MGCCINKKEDQVWKNLLKLSLSLTYRNRSNIIRTLAHNHFEEVVVIDYQRSGRKTASIHKPFSKMKSTNMNSFANPDERKDNHNQSVVIDNNIKEDNQLERELTNALNQCNINSMEFSRYQDFVLSSNNNSHRFEFKNNSIPRNVKSKFERVTTEREFSKTVRFNNLALIKNNNKFKENIDWLSLSKRSETNEKLDFKVTPAHYTRNQSCKDSEFFRKKTISSNIKQLVESIDHKVDLSGVTGDKTEPKVN